MPVYFLRLKNHSTYSKSVRSPFSRSNGGVFVYIERVATAVLPLPPDLGKLPL
jgi:hypothetical protein